jgi:hypothetical protein
VTIVQSLSIKKRDDGGGGVKNYQILRDVIYGRPLTKKQPLTLTDKVPFFLTSPFSLRCCLESNRMTFVQITNHLEIFFMFEKASFLFKFIVICKIVITNAET